MNKIKIAMAVMVVVMVFGTTAVAFAQGPQPPATPTPPKAEYNQTFWQILAQKLGVSVDKLQTAIRDALKETVGKMLSDGKLTQAQADKAQAGIDKLTFDKPLFGQFLAGRRVAEARATRTRAVGKEALEAAATKLGMTNEELVKALREGKTLAGLAKEKNVKPEDLKAAMVAAVNAQIDQAVKDGKLTQEQADKIKAGVEKQIDLNKLAPKNWRLEWFKQQRPIAPRGKTPQPTTP